MKQKLSVLFLCGWYPSKILPTNGDFIQRHAEAISLKHNVTVFHIISDKNLTDNIHISSKEINGIKTHIAYTRYSKNPVKKILLFFKAFKILIQQNVAFDIVHLNEIFPFGVFSLYLKWAKKIPYIITEHWTGYHLPQSKNINFIQKIISIIITKNASFVCPVSNNLANAMINLGLKGNYKKIPNVVDTDVFLPTKNNNKKFNIIHISSLLDTHKNISDMLRVAKNFENKVGFFNWKFIGGASDDFNDLIKSLNFKIAKIEFINHIPQKELVTYLQTSDVFVLFSNYENLPCVILESFSCGVPVISTNVGGISEFFPKDFGALIKPKDKEELLNCLEYYYHNKSIDKDKMHLYAIDNFSKQAILKTFSELYYNSLN